MDVREEQEEEEDWVVSEVHIVPELPACSLDVGNHQPRETIFLSRFPLYSSVVPEAAAAPVSGIAQAAHASAFAFDEEGDLVVPRRRAACAEREQQRGSINKQLVGVITISHSLRSSLPSVGLQVFYPLAPFPFIFKSNQPSLVMDAMIGGGGGGGCQPQIWRGSLVLADFIMQEQDEGRWRDVHALELGAGSGLAGLVMARNAERVWLTGTWIDGRDQVLFPFSDEDLTILHHNRPRRWCLGQL